MPHRSLISPLAFPPLRGGEPTVLVRQRPRMSATFTSTGCRAAILRIVSRNRCDGRQPTRSEEREVEEAAMPGQPVRTRARFRMSLAIHPRELPAATGVTAIVVRQALRDSNVFAEPTLRQKVASRNRKTFPACAEAVDGVTSLWKAEENQE